MPGHIISRVVACSNRIGIGGQAVYCNPNGQFNIDHVVFRRLSIFAPSRFPASANEVQVPPPSEPTKVVLGLQKPYQSVERDSVVTTAAVTSEQAKQPLSLPLFIASFLMMARNVNSEIGAEVNTNNREAPLLSSYFRGVHRPAIRQTRNFRDENFRYRFLKWTALSVSTLFVVNIKSSGITVTTNEEYTLVIFLEQWELYGS